MQPENLYLLISKYLDGVANEEEMKLVDEWYDAFEERSPYYESSSKSLCQVIKERFMALQVTLKAAAE
jgi:hypothetical protein